MPKPMYVWTGTAWVSVASEVESLATYATQSYADNQPGMKLIVPSSIAVGSGSGSVGTQGTVTFTGVSSVSLNNVFSSTYDAYRIVLRVQNTVGGVQTRIRLRTSTDATGSDYYGNLITMGFGSTTVTGVSHNAQDHFRTIEMEATSGVFSSMTADIINPFLAQRTFLVFGGYGNGTGFQGWQQHAVGTSYTGLTVYPSSNNMNGTIQVYGYKIG